MKRTAKRHGAGKKSRDISTTIPVEIDDQLRQLAAASELTRGGYAKEAIIKAVREKFIRAVSRTTIQERKIVHYSDHAENPALRAADDAGA